MATQFYTASSLDGFIADSDDSLEWLLQFGDGSGPEFDEFMAGVGAIAMGAVTYDWMLTHDPGASTRWPFSQPTWVFSHRDRHGIPGADLRFVAGEVTTIYPDLLASAQGKNLWLVGGGDLAGQFHDAGLLDELIVAIAPVTLGAGKPVLPRRIVDVPLDLVDARMVGPFVMARYRFPSPSVD